MSHFTSRPGTMFFPYQCTAAVDDDDDVSLLAFLFIVIDDAKVDDFNVSSDVPGRCKFGRWRIIFIFFTLSNGTLPPPLYTYAYPYRYLWWCRPGVVFFNRIYFYYHYLPSSPILSLLILSSSSSSIIGFYVFLSFDRLLFFFCLRPCRSWYRTCICRIYCSVLPIVNININTIIFFSTSRFRGNQKKIQNRSLRIHQNNQIYIFFVFHW